MRGVKRGTLIFTNNHSSRDHYWHDTLSRKMNRTIGCISELVPIREDQCSPLPSVNDSTSLI